LQTLVSLHDVTPAHLGRLERAETLLRDTGVTAVAYFLVPDFHRRHPIADDTSFRAWCLRPRPYSIEWVLHGYYHLEDAVTSGSSGLSAAIARRTMTAGEGEFLALSTDEQRNRLIRGREAVASIVGVAPRAFVAPAWLFNRTLPPLLAELGFRYTEDHLTVMDAQVGTVRRCPAVTWATRSTIRRVGSRVVGPITYEIARRLGPLRIALHPFDLDHPRTADQARRLIADAVARQAITGYDALFA
jgi:predicted deacetylase